MELVFKNFYLVDEENLEDLTGVMRAQFEIAGRLCYGEEVAFDTILYETYEANCEFWEVFDSQALDNPLYEVWVFDVDTAVVFWAGTTNDTGVGMIQGDFDPMDKLYDTPENRQLAQALGKAFYNRQPTNHLADEGAAQTYQNALKNIKQQDNETNDE